MKKELFSFLCGIEESILGDIIIISPCITFSDLKIFSKNITYKFSGNVYRGCNLNMGRNNITFIKSPQGATFIGDLILSLSRNNYKAIIFFGYAGLLKDIAAGTLFIIDTAYNGEGFSRYILCTKTFDVKILDNYHPDPELKEKAKQIFKDALVGSIYTTGSFCMEFLNRKFIKAVKGGNIDLIDLEVSAFYSACAYKKLKSIGFCLATDNVLQQTILKIGVSYKDLIFCKQKAFLKKIVNLI
ncbi:MAG: hypothetical protein AB1765_07325 [Candidatus Hydrogenedentota bacterium]